MIKNHRVEYPKTRALTLTSLFVSLLSISSFISIPIPFTPIPITLQVFFVILAAIVLGPVYATMACGVYLILGAAGIPVFASSSGGLAILWGPTGGYLFGFVAAAFLGGIVCRNRAPSRRSDIIRLILAAAVSIVAIYTAGVLWLSHYLALPLSDSFLLGALPFIPIDAAKAALAISIGLQIRWSRALLPTTLRHR